MGTFKNRWHKLAASKQYRESFVAAQVKQAIPFQIRRLMKVQELSQQKLAEQSGLTQGAVSRAANPNYGNLSLNTLVRIASGFDVAFVGRFVPFSELGRWLDHLHDDSTAVPNFEAENRYSETLFSTFDEEYAEPATHERTAHLLPFIRRVNEERPSVAAQVNPVPAGVIEPIVTELPQLPTNDVKQPAMPMELYGRTAEA